MTKVELEIGKFYAIGGVKDRALMFLEFIPNPPHLKGTDSYRFLTLSGDLQDFDLHFVRQMRPVTAPDDSNEIP